MVPTKCGRWCHTACVLWIPEAFLEEDSEGKVKADIGNISKVGGTSMSHVASVQSASSSAADLFYGIVERHMFVNLEWFEFIQGLSA